MHPDVAAFLTAIADDPSADAPRLMFADWLEERGEPERAAWMRASIAIGGRRRRSSTTAEEFASQTWEQAAWEQCRPGWWGDFIGVKQVRERGMIRLGIQSASAAHRLGISRSGWLVRAWANGWLADIVVEVSGDPIVSELERWRGAAAVPLVASTYPDISPACFDRLLALPQLRGLHLGHGSVSHPDTARVGRRADLHDLGLIGVDHLAAGRIFGAVGRITELRQLHVMASIGLTDERAADFSSLHHLRELSVVGCMSLSAAGLSRFSVLPRLARLDVENCPNVPADAVAELRRLRPDITIDVR